METVSPIKRRAALATLDANAKPTLSSSPKMMMPLKDGATAASAIPRTGGISPLKKSLAADGVVGGTKRSAVEAAGASPSGKKTCTEQEEDTRRQQQRSRTASPDTSSVFDSSTGDASWSTTATEPDVVDRIIADAPAVLFTQRGNMTREQAREKAQILRLRLGLASYKVRTGQIAIPLADLQAKPLPPHRSVRIQSPSGTQTTPESDSNNQQRGGDEHSAPQASQDSIVTSSSQQSSTAEAEHAPAASGLLSLARGDSFTC